MFVYEQLKNSFFDIKINTDTIQDIMCNLKNDGIDTIGIIIDDLDSFSYNTWETIAKTHGVTIIRFLKIKAYSHLEPTYFLFVISNNFQKSMVQQVIQHLNGQFIPYLSKDAIEFFHRIHYPLIELKEDTLYDPYLEEKMPFGFTYLNNHEYILQHVTKDEKSEFFPDIRDTEECKKWLATYNISSSFSLQSTPFKYNVLGASILNDIDIHYPSEYYQLQQEMAYLQQHNQEIIFHLAKNIQSEGVLFQGAFSHFLLSEKIGLIPKRVSDLSSLTNATPFIVECDKGNRTIAMSQAKNILYGLNMDLKHPLSATKPVFLELFSAILSSQADDETKDFSSTILKWKGIKEKYDSFNGSLNDFLEENVFLSLFFPKEYQCFKQAMELLENDTLIEIEDHNTTVIIPSNTLTGRNERISLSIEALQQLHIPFIKWKTKNKA